MLPPADPNKVDKPIKKRPNFAPLSGVSKQQVPTVDLRQELTLSKTNSEVMSSVFVQDLRDENIEQLHILGKGTQATVTLAIYKPTGTKVALKRIIVQDKSELQCLRRELLALGRCIHPNILRCLGARVSQEQIIISLEYMDAKTLRSLIDTEVKFEEILISLIISEVLKGLYYLHKEHKIIHRDIKPSNLLLNTKGEVKIADFGIAREVNGTEGRANTFLGTLLYMSPERLNAKDYGFSCDIWSVGLVAYECALGRYPCLNDARKANLLDVTRLHADGRLLQFPDHFSEKLKSFLACCLQLEPEKRSRASDLLKHPFILQSEKVSRELFRDWLNLSLKKSEHNLKKAKKEEKLRP